MSTLDWGRSTEEPEGPKITSWNGKEASDQEHQNYMIGRGCDRRGRKMVSLDVDGECGSDDGEWGMGGCEMRATI